MLGGDLCKHLVNLLAAGVMTGAGPLRYGIWSVDCVMVAAVTLMTDAECSLLASCSQSFSLRLVYFLPARQFSLLAF